MQGFNCCSTAKTTFNIRKEIKQNKENLTLKQQTEKYNINLSTVFKWRHREDFHDKKYGAIKPAKSISDIEEHIICEIRKTTLLPLEEKRKLWVLDVVKELGINITRSS